MKKHVIYFLALVGSLFINVISMSYGFFNISQHLYYIPILLGIFFYDKRGIYLSFLTSLLYLFTVYQFDDQNEFLASTIIRCVILVGIAILVYILLNRYNAQAKETLKYQKWLETTLQSIGDGVIATDIHGIVRVVSRETELITGHNKESILDKSIKGVFQFYKDKDQIQPYSALTDLFTEEGFFDIGDDVFYFTPDGLMKILDVKGSHIALSEQEFLGFVIIFRDVTEKKKIQSENIYLTYHDKLTGLYNRRFFEEETIRLDTPENLPISIIIGDVNGLKLTNDAFGHLAGDNLLITAANVLQNSCRKDDVVARWGGDEYIILLPHTTAKEAALLSKQIRSMCSEYSQRELNLSISLGYATKENPNEDLMTIIKKADDLMYKNKLSESRSIKSKAVESILTVLHEKYPREALHSIRVSELCGLIGEKMNMEKSQINDLIVLGKIHDIGKASIDEVILNKPAPLTKEEYEEVKQHSQRGYHIVTASPELSSLASPVLSHHERWDGTGYPNKLKGDNIPFLARILSVADAFESMTSDKTYRSAFSKEDAVKQLIANAGTQFDPEIVETVAPILLNK